MYKYIFFVIVFFMFFTESCFANVELIFPPNNYVLKEKKITFVVKNTTDIEYVYKFKYFKHVIGHPDTHIYQETTEPQATFDLKYRPDDIFEWQVEYSPKETFEGEYEFSTESRIFSLNIEIPVEEEKTEMVDVEEKDLEQAPTLQEKQREKKIVVQEKAFSEKEGFDWNVASDKKDVLGVSEKESSTKCVFKYSKHTNSSSLVSCNIPDLSLQKIESYPFVNEYSTIVEGKLTEKIQIQIDEYGCKKKLFNPSSWFSCEEVFFRSKNIEVYPNITMQVFEKAQRIPILSYTQNGNIFNFVAGHSKGFKNLKLTTRYRIVISEYDIFEDFLKEYTLSTDFAESKKKKPFSFPLEKIFGVTQWYGNTAYQNPHTGIDFGVTNEKILAIGEGEVVSVGTDNNGECNSGGKYILVKQSNGIYSGYFHLSKISIKIGKKVKKGEMIGISGNTGMWNCQKLGYHLHFTTRKTRASNTHVNPVKYINIDWSTVPTIGYKSYPGRLSGENPHPGN